MDSQIAPDGRPSRFDGAAWVSQDGRYWWNGAAWQPIKRRFQPPIAVAGIVLVVLAIAVYVLMNLPKVATHAVVYGVTNAKIDSSTQIEFDYARATICINLSFDYKFLDKGGHQVDEFLDEQPSQVPGGRTVHFTITTRKPINPKAVRFTATATCNG